MSYPTASLAMNTSRPRDVRRYCRLAILAAMLWLPAQAHAQTTIKTDASWGRTPASLSPSASNTSVAGSHSTHQVPGNVYTITEGQGRLAGTNLLHSFEAFSVAARDAAVFTTTTPSLNNVIARVSGASPTTIDGLLALIPASGSAPTLFFINPNGVVFGAGAQVDVPAAFHVSTAKNLKFSDHTVLEAGSGPDSTFTVAAPEAFGFLGNRQASAVAFSSSSKDNRKVDVALGPGSTLGVVAGAVQFQGVDVAAPEAAIRVRATGNAAVDVPITGRAEQPLTGSIGMSDASLSMTGAGSVDFAAGALTLKGGSKIDAATTGPDRGGNIQIDAAQMRIEGLSQITATTSGKGDAGDITLTGESLVVLSGGRIEASTGGQGKGGSITVTTSGDVTLSGLSPNGQMRSGLFAKTQSGGGGDGSGRREGDGGGGGGGKAGNAGEVTVAAKNLLLDGGAQIDSSTTSGGGGGRVAITAAENITIAGSGTRLTSGAPRGDGQGGSITLIANTITVRDGATVAATTGGKGDAGGITLTAFDRLLLQSAATIATTTRGSGKGGSIVIKANEVLLDGPGTAITAGALQPFADMTITIHIVHPNDGDLVVQLDTPTGTRVALLSRVGGSGDDFADTSFNDQAREPITSGSAPFTGTFKPREPLAQLVDEVVRGDWTLNVRDMQRGEQGSLQSWTLQIGGQTFQSTGPARAIPDGGILRSTINVVSPAVALVPATGRASGIGGNVTINSGTVTVQNGATVSAITQGRGAAGSIEVNAARIVVDGPGSAIRAGAVAGSSGETGSLTLVATDSITLSNGALLSIRNEATVDNPSVLNPTVLSVSAPRIALKDATITAESSGNVDASDLRIRFGGRMVVDPSSITTSANEGNGGAIDIEGSGLLWLDHSQVTTAVSGLSGNGGDIRIAADDLLMETGFIQANTAARNASGGNVAINVGSLQSFGSLLVGGDVPLRFTPSLAAVSAIQAAAPEGVSGIVNLSTPVFDVATNLSALRTEIADPAPLTRDLCRLGAGSSLTPMGRGGLRPTALGLVRPDRLGRGTSPSSYPRSGKIGALACAGFEPRNGALSRTSLSR